MISQEAVFVENMHGVFKNTGMSYLLLTLQRFRKNNYIYLGGRENGKAHMAKRQQSEDLGEKYMGLGSTILESFSLFEIIEKKW